MNRPVSLQIALRGCDDVMMVLCFAKLGSQTLFRWLKGVVSPRILGHLLISLDSLGHWIFQVHQNDRLRHVS